MRNLSNYIHAVIRPFLLDQDTYDKAPPTLDARKATSSEQVGYYFRSWCRQATAQVAKYVWKMYPDDSLRMVSQEEALELGHKEKWDFRRPLPVPEDLMKKSTVKG